MHNKCVLFVVAALLAFAAAELPIIEDLELEAFPIHPPVSNLVCPNDCTHNGICYGGRCACFPGFTGPECATVINCINNCSGRGLCHKGACVCDSASTGPDCSTAVPDAAAAQYRCINNCSGNGDCILGICVCREGWASNDCSAQVISQDCPKSCSAHGVCSHGVCFCDASFGGLDCSIERSAVEHSTVYYKIPPPVRAQMPPGVSPVTPPMPMHALNPEWASDPMGPIMQKLKALEDEISASRSVRMKAQFDTPSAGPRMYSVRPSRYVGQAAGAGAGVPTGDQAPRCLNDCNGNGDCDVSSGYGICKCADGWTGLDCGQEVLCKNNCMNHGTCTKGECTCDPGFLSDDCSTLDVCRNGCFGHGYCVGGHCLCDPGYSGPDCREAMLCGGGDCNGHGSCLQAKCACNPGFYGADCSIQGHEWKGNYCPNCEDGNCNPNTTACKCLKGYEGRDCGRFAHTADPVGNYVDATGQNYTQKEMPPPPLVPGVPPPGAPPGDLPLPPPPSGSFAGVRSSALQYPSSRVARRGPYEAPQQQHAAAPAAAPAPSPVLETIPAVARFPVPAPVVPTVVSQPHASPTAPAPLHTRVLKAEYASPVDFIQLQDNAPASSAGARFKAAVKRSSVTASAEVFAGHGKMDPLPSGSATPVAPVPPTPSPSAPAASPRPSLFKPAHASPTAATPAPATTSPLVPAALPAAPAPVPVSVSAPAPALPPVPVLSSAATTPQSTAAAAAENSVAPITPVGTPDVVPAVAAPVQPAVTTAAQDLLAQQEKLDPEEMLRNFGQYIDPESGKVKKPVSVARVSSTWECDNNCSAHGVCEDDVCVCDVGYGGPACEYVMRPCPANCTDHGVCNGMTGKCTCSPEWAGEDCGQLLPCPGDCNNHGYCVHGRCYCDPGYAGVACKKPIFCSDECNLHGTCNDGTCNCHDGYYGVNCDHDVPFCGMAPPGQQDCSGHGSCRAGTCSCSSDYSGHDCSKRSNH